METKKEERPNYKQQAATLAAELSDLKRKLEETERERQSHKTSSEYWSKRTNEIETQLDEMNAFLDNLPDPPPSQTKDEREYMRKPIAPQSRFAIWLASKLQVSFNQPK